jgi:hypothetical protein
MLTAAGKRASEAVLISGLFGQFESFPPVQKANCGVKLLKLRCLDPLELRLFLSVLLQLTDQALKKRFGY